VYGKSTHEKIEVEEWVQHQDRPQMRGQPVREPPVEDSGWVSHTGLSYEWVYQIQYQEHLRLVCEGLRWDLPEKNPGT